ncbi:MAG: hypothetical protein ACW96M_02270 [Candidatus Thorarchaeota archaeon]|jgi:hypothetical protein
MNNEFVFDDVELPAFSFRDLLLILVGGIVSATLAVLLVTPDRRVSELTLLLSSINIVSMTFSTGLFSFLTAGVLFTSQTSRQYLLRRIKLVGERRAFLVRILHAIVVVSIFTIVMTIVAFLIPIMLNWYPTIPSHFAAIPAVLVASLIGSACLVTLASFIASLMDDSRLSLLLGCASTILIAQVTGWSAERIAVRYSLTRNLALLSPHNLVKGLAIQLNGYQFESANDMVSYVGFVVSTQSLVSVLVPLMLLSIASLIASYRVLINNSTRWQSLPRMIPNHEVWSSATTLEVIGRIRRSLRLQRGLATIIIALLLFSINISGSAYTSNLEISTTIVHYESPVTGEILQVGVWNIFDVEVQPPAPGLFNLLSLHWEITSWGNASDSLSIYYEILEMTSTEFTSLNESSRLGLVSSRVNQTFGTGGGRGVGLEESYGAYICVLKFISEVDPLENSYVVASLLIEQTGY